jgi:hypothetical protein
MDARIAAGGADYPRLMDKVELVQTITAGYEAVVAQMEHISDARLREPAMDDWTGKDLLAHLAWWHDHSVLVIEELRAGRQPYDGTDPANATDAFNERSHREHLGDPPEATRRAFHDSFRRLLSALEPVTDEELFSATRWPWLGGEPLAETVLWDTSRHYEEHRAHLAPLVG